MKSKNYTINFSYGMNSGIGSVLKSILSCFPLFLLAFIFVSCDPVSEDERYVEVDAIEAKRVVLLEEFTGQNCPNCPTAHRAIEALQEQYGSSLIPVSIHAGSFAYDEGEYGNYFFKTPEGDQYANMWEVSSYPSGVVNRGKKGLSAYTDWAASVREELVRPTVLDMELTAEIEDGQIVTKTKLRPSADVNGYLQLWVLEDNLVSVQLDGSTLLTDYVHNNVYRASINGVGGELVQLKSNVFQNTEHKFPLRSYWNSENLSVVAFVYDNSGVVQAIRTYVNK